MAICENSQSSGERGKKDDVSDRQLLSPYFASFSSFFGPSGISQITGELPSPPHLIVSAMVKSTRED